MRIKAQEFASGIRLMIDGQPVAGILNEEVAAVAEEMRAALEVIDHRARSLRRRQDRIDGLAMVGRVLNGALLEEEAEKADVSVRTIRTRFHDWISIVALAALNRGQRMPEGMGVDLGKEAAPFFALNTRQLREPLYRDWLLDAINTYLEEKGA